MLFRIMTSLAWEGKENGAMRFVQGILSPGNIPRLFFLLFFLTFHSPLQAFTLLTAPLSAAFQSIPIPDFHCLERVGLEDNGVGGKWDLLRSEKFERRRMWQSLLPPPFPPPPPLTNHHKGRRKGKKRGKKKGACPQLSFHFSTWAAHIPLGALDTRGCN